MKKAIIILVILVFAAAIMFVPYRKDMYNDGGTVCYTSLTYQVVHWNRLYDDGNVSGYHVAKDLYVFPFNFRDNVSGKVWDEYNGRFVYQEAPRPLEDLLR